MTSTLTVRPVAGHIGADIAGVDLAERLDQPTVAAILVAGRPFTADHKVVVHA